MTRTGPRTPAWFVVAALVAVTAVWGSTFVVVKDAVERMPVLDFLAWRFVLATLAMVALRPRALHRLGPHGRRVGGWLGLALGAGYVLQTFGLRTASAASVGFITGMFVVFTPLAAALLTRRRVSAWAWGSVALATVGLGLLSLQGFAVGTGELLTVGCAVAFALHIVGLGEWSSSHAAYGLAIVQLGVVGLTCSLASATDGVQAPDHASVWWALAITSLAATALAFVVQTWAQARIAPTRAAVVMTMEPVFAGLFAVGVADEPLGTRQLVGATFIVAAMLTVELGPRRGAEGATTRLEA